MFQVLDGAAGSGPRLAATVAATTAPLANPHLRVPREAATHQVLSYPGSRANRRGRITCWFDLCNSKNYLLVNLYLCIWHL